MITNSEVNFAKDFLAHCEVLDKDQIYRETHRTEIAFRNQKWKGVDNHMTSSPITILPFSQLQSCLTRTNTFRHPGDTTSTLCRFACILMLSSFGTPQCQRTSCMESYSLEKDQHAVHTLCYKDVYTESQWLRLMWQDYNLIKRTNSFRVIANRGWRTVANIYILLTHVHTDL